MQRLDAGLQQILREIGNRCFEIRRVGAEFFVQRSGVVVAFATFAEGGAIFKLATGHNTAPAFAGGLKPTKELGKGRAGAHALQHGVDACSGACQGFFDLGVIGTNTIGLHQVGLAVGNFDASGVVPVELLADLGIGLAAPVVGHCAIKGHAVLAARAGFALAQA